MNVIAEMGSVTGGAPDSLAIVIPTYDERSNIEPLLFEFARLRASWDRVFHIIFVDDSSPDGTGEAADRLGKRLGISVTVVTRPPPRNLGTAIAQGIAQTDANLVCVMDADLSHPPSLLPSMLKRLDGFDGVVASRYAPGGRIADWPVHRRLISYVATALARSVAKSGCTDPLSGYFLFRNPAIRGVSVTGLGNKPLLEVLGQTSLAICDLPYEFSNRKNGTSKLSLAGILSFVRLLALSASRARTSNRALRSHTGQTPSQSRES